MNLFEYIKLQGVDIISEADLVPFEVLKICVRRYIDEMGLTPFIGMNHPNLPRTQDKECYVRYVTGPDRMPDLLRIIYKQTIKEFYKEHHEPI